MKTTHKLLGSVAVAAILFTGCGGGGGGNAEGSQSSSTQIEQSERATQVTMDFQLTSLFEGSNIGKRELRAATLSQGEMTIINVDSGASKTETFNLFIDESDFSVSTSKTLLLDPGTYSSTMIVERDGIQYYGEVQFEVNDGQQTIPQMSITPIIGDLVTNVNVASELYTMNLAYEVNELTAFTNPKIGVIVDGGEELLFTINKATGLSETRWNMATGEHEVAVNFYDGSLQVGKSKLSSYSVDFAQGSIGNLDIVPLSGTSKFNFDVESSSLNMEFNVPSVVATETGGVENLQALLTVVNENNSTFYEVQLTESNESFSGNVIVEGVSLGELTYSLEFFDINDNEKIASCNLSTLVDSSSKTTTCDIDLVRRGVAGGSLLNNIGFTVYDSEGKTVSGAELYNGSDLIGVTDLNGFLQTNLTKGLHTVNVSFNGANGSVNISESSVLENLNYDVYLSGDATVSPDLEWTYEFNTEYRNEQMFVDRNNEEVLIQDGNQTIKMTSPDNKTIQVGTTNFWSIKSVLLNNGNLAIIDDSSRNFKVYEDNNIVLREFEYERPLYNGDMIVNSDKSEVLFGLYDSSNNSSTIKSYSSDGTTLDDTSITNRVYDIFDIDSTLNKIITSGTTYSSSEGYKEYINVAALGSHSVSFEVPKYTKFMGYSDKRKSLYYSTHRDEPSQIVSFDVENETTNWVIDSQSLGYGRAVLTNNQNHLVFDGNYTANNEVKAVSLNLDTLESCEFPLGLFSNTDQWNNTENGAVVTTYDSSDGNSTRKISYLNPDTCEVVDLVSKTTVNWKDDLHVIDTNGSKVEKKNYIYTSNLISDVTKEYEVSSFDESGNKLGSLVIDNSSQCNNFVAFQTENNTIVYIKDNKLEELDNNLNPIWTYNHSSSFDCTKSNIIKVFYDRNEAFVQERGKLHKIKF